ncbi:MarR family winged helix-turn-helix transcriptional regulator [Curtobacterium oceanosedimentum]|uniref:MarR family transcriptional regulator n=1 Tax=Curtobacterium oceanosedimentum TaxID=465820 RepID=A0A147DQZ7_9MICO|nr:MarR family transcriptional regulator [Curtobacterium oceanosedimentum]KTR52000.1 MarR family transcriptional regulator [Curtobacterium oceanosedimentum]
MCQARIDLDSSVGYVLKEAASALRAAMEDALRPLGMTVTHYSCLELLAQRPGMSNSELARGTFVTRQSMNTLLQQLERDGIVTRPSTPTSGKVLPTTLTEAGRRQREAASAAVRQVELRMTRDLDDDARAAAFRLLRGMVAALRDERPTDATG